MSASCALLAVAIGLALLIVGVAAMCLLLINQRRPPSPPDKWESSL